MTDTTRASVAARLPEGRGLDAGGLTDRATLIGRTLEPWEHLMRHDPEERVNLEPHPDAHAEVWLICWPDHQDPGFHDHDLSSDAVYVCDGTLAENHLEATPSDLRETVTERPAGTVFSFDAARIHRMHYAGGGPGAESFHATRPHLVRVGLLE